MVKLQSSKLTSWVRFPPSLYFFLFFLKFIEEVTDFFFFNKYLRKFFFNFFGDFFFFKKLHSKFVFFFEKFNVFNFFYFLFFIFYFKNKYLLSTFFFSMYKIIKNNLNITKKNFFLFFRISLFFLLFLLFYILFSYTLENIPASKLFFVWGSWGFFLYIFISGFNFFGKKYSYGKYTEALQRFWKRSFSIFWLLEGFIFVAFVYLTFNASSEVVYSYDPQVLFKLRFISLRFFFFKMLALTFLILCFTLVSSINLNKKFNMFIFNTTSLFVIIIFLIESDQYISILNYSNFFEWSFNHSDFVLDSDFRKARIVNSYVLLIGIAKYLHILFIVFIWFFNMSKNLENLESRDYISSACSQNAIILYILNWFSIYPYVKYFFRTYYYSTFSWFFFDFKNDSIFNFVKFLFNFWRGAFLNLFF